jgi:alkanesulfonate monooxygenase SsuD/methylene tetrahydromethanopterin reductase-like flavin-dependent oxidoreductase (luciferase family)
MVKFGIFDHLDDAGVPAAQQFEERLKLIELMEAQGFYAYHVAEHHSTPLGTAPSPSVFLAAAAQRTRTIRLGPLVYVLPLHHPLRLYEEICMLDHMSGGRLQIGVGRGGALIEHQRYGVDPAVAQATYHEGFAVLMRAFTDEVVNFEGRFYRFKDYLVTRRPFQRPHPPIWYGIPSPDAVPWALSHAINVISLGPVDRACEVATRYRAAWAHSGRPVGDTPFIGITRHIVVGETDTAAKRLANAAYPGWRDAMEFLWRRSSVTFSLASIYPPSFDELAAIGHGVAGCPATVRRYMTDLLRASHVNYVACQMVFGPMSYADSAASIRLFGREVMPEFAQAS